MFVNAAGLFSKAKASQLKTWAEWHNEVTVEAGVRRGLAFNTATKKSLGLLVSAAC